tara:strand:+ start:35680 stop:37386 length:1707 start_codon:yes stop_codon:yes gene_type:complete
MKKLIIQIWPYIRPYKRQAILAVLCLVPMALTKAYIAYFIKNVIDGIFNANATFDYAITLAATIVGITILTYPFRYIHYFGLRMVVDKALCDLRRDLYKKFQNLPSSYFSEARQGKLLSIMVDDTKMFAMSFNSAIAIIREPVTALGLLGVMVYHDWKLTAIVFGIIPFFIIVFNVTGKRIKRYVKKSQEDQSVMTHHASEGLSGQKIIKAFGLQKYMIQRFDQAQDQFLANKKVSNSTEEHSHPLIEVLISVAFAIVIIASFMRAKEGELSVGEFFSFVGAFGMFMDPIRRYSKANAKLNQAKASADRIFKIMEVDEEEDPGSIDKFDFSESIEFNNVTFSYGKGDVLKDFNLKINKGEKVALVGLSGSGKSTALSLLLRLYDYGKGQILIDGKELKDYKLQTLRSLFALVSQDVFLFNDTVKENIKAGENFTDEQISTAFEVSYADEFVHGLPEGIETEIGDRGLKLSGGQAQRLTIARAFLRDCPILLFDEATSALDNESERIVQKALEKVAAHKTVLAVAHRLSTIQNYDRIIVMKEGQKVQEGTHDELMSSDGEYKKLYELSQ